MVKNKGVSAPVGVLDSGLGHMKIIGEVQGEPIYGCEFCSFAHLDIERAKQKVLFCTDGCKKGKEGGLDGR